MKIKVFFSRTIQVRSYEPEKVSFEVECEEESWHRIRDTAKMVVTQLAEACDDIVGEREAARARTEHAAASAAGPAEPDDYIYADELRRS